MTVVTNEATSSLPLIRLALSIAMAVVEIFIGQSEVAYSQTGSGGGAHASFIPPYTSMGGGNASLHLEAVFALEEHVSPGMTYAIREISGQSKIAYFVIVRHSFSEDVSSDFPCDVDVIGQRGRIEQSLVIDKYNCAFNYSVAVDLHGIVTEGAETLNVQGIDVDLSKGRLLIVDMTGEQVEIEQIEDAEVKIPQNTTSKTAGRILEDVYKDLKEGKTKSRRLKIVAG